MAQVEVFLNQNTRECFFDGYKPGDALGEPFTYESSITDALAACEAAFMIFNMDLDMLRGRSLEIATAYRERRMRSLSVGDIVKVDGVAYACDSFGFRKVEGGVR